MSTMFAEFIFYIGDLAVLISPLILLSMAAIILMLQSPAKDGTRNLTPVATALISLFFSIVIFAFLQSNYNYNLIAVFGLLKIEPLSALVTLLILVGAAFSIVITATTPKSHQIHSPADYFALLFLSLCGAWIVLVANELITLFVGLEIMSLALYALCASASSKPSSVESGFKYLILGSFSSAFFFLGIVFYFGATGSLQLSDEVFSFPLAQQNSGLLLLAFGLMILAAGFKIALAPFHVWAADVYEGAPTGLTAFMATAIKAVSVILLFKIMRPLLVPESPGFELGQGMIWLFAVLSMVVGNLLAFKQKSLKRMLAYSSVAHAGYLLLSFSAGGVFASYSAIFYYLLVYLFLAVGAFAVLALLEESSESSDPILISDLSGMYKKFPGLAFALAIFLVGLAGLPPVFGGLLGKVMVFGAALNAGWTGAVIVAALSALVGSAYYLRCVYQIYFEDAAARKFEFPAESKASLALLGIIILCALVAVGAGIFPSFFLFPWLTPAIS